MSESLSAPNRATARRFPATPQRRRAQARALRDALGKTALLWPYLLALALSLLAAGLAVGHQVPALPVLILFADALALWHLHLIRAERRRAALLDAAACRAAALELAALKVLCRNPAAPAQASLPFSAWLDDLREGRWGGLREDGEGGGA